MSQERTPSRRLGRGLEALLGTASRPAAAGDAAATVESGEGAGGAAAEGGVRGRLLEIPVSEIRPNHFQPRREFTLAELNELRDSIKAAGLLQPVTVRSSATGRGYELVAGERRLRAVKDLGWRTIPAIVRDYDDRSTLALALVENLQREDLNPIEEASGYARLAQEFGLGQAEIAELVGKDRSTIANLLRILGLPREVQRMLETGELTTGHARPLLALEDEAEIVRLAREIRGEGLSVRNVEERVRREAPVQARPKRGRPRRDDARPAGVRDVEDRLRRRLQTDVSVRPGPKETGELRIRFYSYADLDRLLALLGVAE